MPCRILLRCVAAKHVAVCYNMLRCDVVSRRIETLKHPEMLKTSMHICIYTCILFIIHTHTCMYVHTHIPVYI